jgi:two-component system, chemotaxis family, protein-glutamate methylesterase/glutaminase
VFSLLRTSEASVKPDAVVAIGASLGGVEALTELVSALEADLPAAVLIALHVGRGPSHLPALLARNTSLPCSHAEDGTPLSAGHVEVAPPDHHMNVHDGVLKLSRGPKENWARPAIDPLFRSAAEVFGPRTIGVVLTGRLNDGTAGLISIRQAGGVAVVQHPLGAEAPEMPASALRHAGADHVAALKDIGPLVMKLVRDLARSAEAMPAVAGVPRA